ncbi:Ribonuclease H-like domain,Ribonuclease H domain,Ribonuclease H1, eukaryote,Ribonuclease H1, N- [Cinara cedri]|uniref:Ribonuclease H1 n=1 Tax=Cinara cedri TaxID=506608 RepID=A0A5E4M0L6_9HEMI|nr:Ribonuclease H-like domain,Ribonuclease H domain,Ribonuclease H1, eukaryote,Ribonuclease H1, N- [Cinara cedri]
MSSHCWTNYYLVYFKQISRFLKMPFYAVIFKTKKVGSIADNWDTARTLKDGIPNSYAKKFLTKSEAENYIKELSFKVLEDNDRKGIKRKQIEIPLSPIVSLINEHITKAKTAFNDLHLLVTSISDIPPAHKGQLKVLIEEVFDKVDALLNIDKSNKIEPLDVITTNCADIKDCSTTSIKVDDVVNPKDANLKQSEIARAKDMFNFNKKNEVIVYTDGACLSNGFAEAAGGLGVWFGPNNPLNLSEKLSGLQTNNHAEIHCTIRAIERVKLTGIKRINIHTDSEYVINCVTKWVPIWEKNGWKTTARKPVKNIDILKLLQKKINSMDSVSWVHVSGHTGITGNEEADKLAKAGAIIK